MTEPDTTDDTTTADETPDEAAQPAEVDWKSEARKWEQRAKDNRAKLREAEPIVSQWKQLEEASKSDMERQREETTRWQAEAEKWRASSVSSRIEALAAPDFVYPADALSKLNPASYLDAGGTIDDDRIKADLAALLDERPNWRRQATKPGPRVPAPNTSQGSGVGGRAVADPRSEFAALIGGAVGPTPR